jgi:hypothetical protein
LKTLAAAADSIVADAGGAPTGRSLYDRLKFEAILNGERAMGVAAHNLGAAEAALGPDYLRDVAARIGVPLVSTNVTAADGRPVAEQLRVVEAGGRNVAIFGVLSPKFAAAGLRVAPPQEAVLGALRQAAGRYQAAIVLAYLPEDELLALAETLPEVDAIVGGPTGQPLAPRHAGPTLVLSATRQGKFLARLTAPADARGRWSGQIDELTACFADDAAQLANVEGFRQELARRDLAAGDTSFIGRLPLASPPEFYIAGSTACVKCHKQDFKVWSKSRHARAWKSLVDKGSQVDPECQRCHTTAYSQPGGFVSPGRSPALVNVGCEDCHGPSREHVREPKVHTAYFGRAADQCVACHDVENSPRFDFNDYWSRIRHGKKEQQP